MKNLKKIVIASLVTGLCATSSFCAESTTIFAPIAPGVKSIDITLNGESFTIMRNQAKDAKISPLYETTFRGTPQPIVLAPGVETLGEIEFIDYMKKAETDTNIAIIDSRKPGWFARLRIPGAVNVPFTNFEDKDDAADMMEDYMGVKINDDGSFDFTNAKTLALYCNGYWCGQTPGMVKNAKFALLKVGYPAEKIKYYRGGMQAWTSMGFTVVGSGK